MDKLGFIRNELSPDAALEEFAELIVTEIDAIELAMEVAGIDDVDDYDEDDIALEDDDEDEDDDHEPGLPLNDEEDEELVDDAIESYGISASEDDDEDELDRAITMGAIAEEEDEDIAEEFINYGEDALDFDLANEASFLKALEGCDCDCDDDDDDEEEDEDDDDKDKDNEDKKDEEANEALMDLVIKGLGSLF